jgi:hypothetical protein
MASPADYEKMAKRMLEGGTFPRGGGSYHGGFSNYGAGVKGYPKEGHTIATRGPVSETVKTQAQYTKDRIESQRTRSPNSPDYKKHHPYNYELDRAKEALRSLKKSGY